MDIRIVQSRDDLSRLIGSVKCYADSERRALGFLPEPVYDQALLQGKLLAVVGGRDESYLGHLMYGGTFPYLRIFQVVVVPRYRKRKIGSLLVDRFIMDAERDGYLSISVRVAEDLREANCFWENKEFCCVRTIRGGSTTHRRINVRVRELESPRLFAPPPAHAEEGNLLPQRLSRKPSLYVLDVNVLLDLLKERARADDVRKIINAAFNNSIRVHITEEFIAELNRASRPNALDPVVELARSLPRLPAVRESVLAPKCQQLARLLFPENTKKATLSSNQKSDAIHLATAIHHGADGFITSDQGILRKRQELLWRYSIEVTGVAELVALAEPSESSVSLELHTVPSGDSVQFLEMKEEQRHEVQRFLSRMCHGEDLVQAAVSPGASGALRRRIQVQILPSRKMVAFASWDSPSRLKEQIDVHVAVDDEHPSSVQIADHLLGRVLNDMVGNGPTVLLLKNHTGQSQINHVAMTHGFRSSNNQNDGLIKVCVGGVVQFQNWPRVRSRVERLTGVGFPESLPAFNGANTSLTLMNADGSSFAITVEELESLLSPVVLLLPGRQGIVVPIQRSYSDDLLGTSAQLSFFPLQEAALYRERVYYSSGRTNAVFQPGLTMLFYESGGNGGRGAVVACARVLGSQIMWKEGVSEKKRRKGVLSRGVIDSMNKGNLVSVTSFDNIVPFKKPVGLSLLRMFGAIDGANAATSRRIDSEALRLVLAEGMASV